jgi:hypothetical protein
MGWDDSRVAMAMQSKSEAKTPTGSPRASKEPTGRPGRCGIALRFPGPAPPCRRRLFQGRPSRARPFSGEAQAIDVPKRSMGSGARPQVSEKTRQDVCFLRVSSRTGWRSSSRRGRQPTMGKLRSLPSSTWQVSRRLPRNRATAVTVHMLACEVRVTSSEVLFRRETLLRIRAGG